MKFPDEHKPFAEQDPEVLLGMLVWGEGRDQPSDGRAAIAHSVLNRQKRKPAVSLTDLILQPWQYDCFMPHDPNSVKLLRPVAAEGLGVWAGCLKSASEAMAGLSADTSVGATHYVRKELWLRPAVDPRHPRWFELPCVASGLTKKTAVVGDHVFATTPF